MLARALTCFAADAVYKEQHSCSILINPSADCVNEIGLHTAVLDKMVARSNFVYVTVKPRTRGKCYADFKIDIEYLCPPPPCDSL